MQRVAMPHRVRRHGLQGESNPNSSRQVVCWSVLSVCMPRTAVNLHPFCCIRCATCRELNVHKVCVCVCERERERAVVCVVRLNATVCNEHAHTSLRFAICHEYNACCAGRDRTERVCVCVCVCVCVIERESVCVWHSEWFVADGTMRA